jgi:hypothetical protein
MDRRWLLKRNFTMAKKFTLKKRTIFDTGDVLYYSGFALTDNKNFCQFFVKKFPKLNYNFRKFAFSESDLIFSLDKEVNPVVNHNYAVFDSGKIDLLYFNHFQDRFKSLKFFVLKDFRNESALGKILVFDTDKNKVVGIFNLDPITNIEEEA